MELLADQQAAVQLVLACNQALVQRFADSGFGEDVADGHSIAVPWNGGAHGHVATRRHGAGAEGLKPSCKPLGAWGAVLADAMDASSPPARRLAPEAAAPPLSWRPTDSAPPLSWRASPDSHRPLNSHRPSSSIPEEVPDLSVNNPLISSVSERNLFDSAAASKRNIQNAITEPEFDAEQSFKDTGVWQAIARNSAFKSSGIAMIMINIIWLGIDTDYNKASILCNAPLIFQVVDNVFCSYFFFEMTVRLLACKRFALALKDTWLVFDMVLVLTMVWETWVAVAVYLIMDTEIGRGSSKTSAFRVFRLVRLVRVARMARVMRSVPELMILVKALSMAVRSVFATLLLLVVTIYTFAVFLTMLLAGSEASMGYFTTVPQSMNTLLLQGVFGGNNDVFDRMLGESLFYYMVFLLFMVFGSLTVLNMLIGVICEVVSSVAESEKAEVAAKELKNVMSHIVKHVDVDCSKAISKDEFVSLLDNGDAMRALHLVGVDVVALVDFVDFIFRGEDELDIGDFAETVVQFRGSNTATVKDIVDLRMFISAELSRVDVRLTTLGR